MSDPPPISDLASAGPNTATDQAAVLAAMLRIAEGEIRAKDEQHSLLQQIIATNERELAVKTARIAELEAQVQRVQIESDQFKSLFDSYLTRAEAARSSSAIRHQQQSSDDLVEAASSSSDPPPSSAFGTTSVSHTAFASGLGPPPDLPLPPQPAASPQINVTRGSPARSVSTPSRLSPAQSSPAQSSPTRSPPSPIRRQPVKDETTLLPPRNEASLSPLPASVGPALSSAILHGDDTSKEGSGGDSPDSLM